MSKRVRSAIVGRVPEGVFAEEQDYGSEDDEGQREKEGWGEMAAGEEIVQGSSSDENVAGFGKRESACKTVETMSVAEAGATDAAATDAAATAAAATAAAARYNVAVDGNKSDKLAVVTASSTAGPTMATGTTSTEAELRQRLLAVMGQARNSKDKRGKTGPAATAKAR